jgi:hypothetical protein
MGIEPMPQEDEPPVELRKEPADFRRPPLRGTQRNDDTIPQSLDAEKAVLSSILINPKYSLALAASVIDVPHFVHPSHALIFSTLFRLWNHNKPVDLVTLTTELLERKCLDNAGGAGALAELQTFVPTASNIEYYLDILKEKYAARRLLEISSLIKDEASAPKADLAGLLDSVTKQLKTIQAGSKAGALPPLDDMSSLIGDSLPKPPTELVEGILHRGSKLIIGGTSKGRKTFSLMDLGISVATGTKWWGCQTIQGKVCYINFEIQKPFFAKRFEDICKKKGATPSPGMFMCWTLRGLVDGIEKMADDIIKRLLEENYVLIIFDPIYKALGNRDENKAGDVASMLNELEAIAVKTGAAIAFGAHYSKGNQAAKDSMDRIGGSGVFARDPDAILTMTPHALEEHFTIDATLRNFPPQEPFVVKWEWPLFQRDEALDPKELKQPKGPKSDKDGKFQQQYKVDDVIMALDELGSARKPSELLNYLKEQLGIAPSTFWRLWKETKQSPFIVRAEKGRFCHVNNASK